MEKGNPTRNSSAKANSSEPKSKQDAHRSNRFHKFKEDVSSRPEARSKPNPQKSRDVYDKRPRLRGGQICERYRNEVAHDFHVGSVSKQGSKKVNLNHLLNFTLAPSENRDYSSRPARNKIRLPKYNKELFLQANCQFVIRDDGDYTQQWRNPDILVEWSIIVEIRLPSHEVPSCPICLFTPVAAKITRCGHIYCWPCMLHYLALTDKAWQKCPICFEAVHKTDLKSVRSVTQHHFFAGDKIFMFLVRREKGCFSPTPVTHKSLPYPYHVNSDGDVTCFQKLLLANKTDMKHVIARERTELLDLWAREKDAPESCFIVTALKLLDEQDVILGKDIPLKPMKESEESLLNYKSFANRNEVLNEWPITIESDTTSGDAASSTQSDVKTTFDVKENNNSRKGKEVYYFYQAADGQHIYLNSLNVRMLVKEFGSLQNSPLVIEADILELEKISMTEENRKRLRYLQHIPLTCEFQVAELNINHLLAKPTIQEYSAEVWKRQSLRQKKVTAERKREKFLKVEENRKLGKYPGATYNLNSTDHFPAYKMNSLNFSFEQSPPVNMPTRGELEILNYDSQYPAVGISNLTIDNPMSSPPVTSFAQVLQAGQVNFNEVPLRGPKTCISEVDASKTKADFSDDESHTLVPEYRNSFSSALEAAFNTAMKQETNENQVSKKKKKKNKILFSTSLCHSKYGPV